MTIRRATDHLTGVVNSSGSARVAAECAEVRNGIVLGDGLAAEDKEQNGEDDQRTAGVAADNHCLTSVSACLREMRVAQEGSGHLIIMPAARFVPNAACSRG